MKYLPFLSRPCIGIDIQSHALHLVQIRKNRRGLILEQAISLPLSNEKDQPWEKISSALENWTRSTGLVGASAAVNVPSKLARMQHLQLPLGISDELIEAEIHAQVERDFPGMSAALSMDYSILTQKKKGYADIFFVVARLEQVSQYVHCIQNAGLKLKIIDIDIYALKRLFKTSLLAPQPINERHALLFFLRDKLILLIADTHEILAYKEWSRVETDSLWPQIENSMQHFLATAASNGSVKIGLYANETELPTLLREARHLLLGEVFALNPWLAITLQANSSLYSHPNPEDYFFACGSVMQEMPIW